jgi:3-deoxy-manno-octulosonate cytidylyltransferase (CMP-KDO synthetase)
MIHPDMVTLALRPLLEDSGVLCSNLASPITSEAEFDDPNTIKVVLASNGDALYFSREAIPTRHRLEFGHLPAFKQVCIIPFRREFLLHYAELTPTPLEEAESIDMLRAVEHGFPVRLVHCDKQTHAVDTPSDLGVVEKLMADDPLTASY